jgi:hypothetical protein
MLIDVDLKKKLVIANLLITHCGWKKDIVTTWSLKINSPTRKVIFWGNSFYDENRKNTLNFKISEFNKITLDTTQKLLIFGDNLFAVDVS